MIVDAILLGVLTPLALLWTLPLVSDLMGSIRRARVSTAAAPPNRRTVLAFLVPAHDEELLIESCVRSLVGMHRRTADSDVFVIADNCSDDTAAIAARVGARVLVREDRDRRGKPYAIGWALQQLETAAYDAVVIIDADTVVVPEFADALAARRPLREKAVQAYFDVGNGRDSWLSRLGGLLAKVRYEGQYPHKQRAGLNCPLTGNGMCLGTGLLKRAGWAQGTALTENWELYARYTAAGESIEYAPAARLESQEAHTLAESATQRRRWQAGRLAVLRRYGRALLTSRKVGVHQKIDALGELAAPGPILHVTLAATLALVLMLQPDPLLRIVGVWFLLSVVPTVAWTFNAWIRQPDRGALALALLRLPFYAVWRLFVAALALRTARSGGWHRSPRHSQESS